MSTGSEIRERLNSRSMYGTHLFLADFPVASSFGAAVAVDAPVWYESANVCALADSERHLAHAFRTERGWTAYNCTRSNPAGNGFAEIGTFMSVDEAKTAIKAVFGIFELRSMAAGSVHH